MRRLVDRATVALFEGLLRVPVVVTRRSSIRAGQRNAFELGVDASQNGLVVREHQPS